MIVRDDGLLPFLSDLLVSQIVPYRCAEAPCGPAKEYPGIDDYTLSGVVILDVAIEEFLLANGHHRTHVGNRLGQGHFVCLTVFFQLDGDHRALKVARATANTNRQSSIETSAACRNRSGLPRTDALHGHLFQHAASRRSIGGKSIARHCY